MAPLDGLKHQARAKPSRSAILLQIDVRALAIIYVALYSIPAEYVSKFDERGRQVMAQTRANTIRRLRQKVR